MQWGSAAGRRWGAKPALPSPSTLCSPPLPSPPQEEIDLFLSEQQDEEDDADDDFEPEPAAKKAKTERGAAPAAPPGDCVAPLSAKRFASVRQYGGRLMADVREFYEKDGQLQVGGALRLGYWLMLRGVAGAGCGRGRMRSWSTQPGALAANPAHAANPCPPPPPPPLA